MFKSICRALLLFVAVLMVAPAAKAQMALPVDANVRIGKLPNGLTYYIRHNETPKGLASFYIAQKVGSILEEENQRGLAHFLEHMCFNGTTHYPDNALRDWLESIGVKFGANLNAYTSIDETVYNISDVPVARTSVQDSCLLILHDWANDLTLDPKAIDDERGVIHEEWRRSMSGQMRIIENLLPVIYPDNRYGYRLPIGTIDVIDNFTPQEIRDYYETWYRPDQQGIIVVGDIDVDYIEGKIKEMFSEIEMPANAKERTYLPVEDNEGTIYAIGSDPEQKYAVIDMMFKTDAFPDSLKNDIQYLVYDYVTDMISGMLNQRLSDMGQKVDAPFASASAGYGQFFVSKTKDCFELEGVAKGNDIEPTLEAIYRELLRARDGGFTVGEYERFRNEYLSRLESAYNKRDKRENDTYVREYVKNFTDNEPIPSIEDEYQLMQMIAAQIPVEAINSILPEMITQDNRVIMVLAPQNGTFNIPTQESLAAVIAKVDAEDIEPYKDEMKEEPLIPQLPTAGSIVSESYDKQWDAQVLTLSNGVKVIVKKTDLKNDQILFNAIAIGGSSTVPDNQAVNLIFMPYAMGTHGLGDYTSVDLQKYLQGKQCNVSLSIDEYNRELSGNTTVKDLPTLMELIYMTFVDYEINADEFAATQSKLANILANQESSPEFVFSKYVQEVLFDSPAQRMITTEIVNAANREAILDIIHNATANAADYTFSFVGDIDMDALRPLLEQYIATLPANAKTKTTKYSPNTSREVKPGKGVNTTTTKMETPQTWCMIVAEGTMPYTVKNRMVSAMAGQILSARLISKIREEMGATYSLGAQSQMSRQGKYNTVIQIPFPMKPELKEQVLAEIEKIFNDMTKDVTDSELTAVKEYLAKEYTSMKDQNEGWSGAISATQLNGVDIFNPSVEVINSITTKDIKKFMKDLLKQGNYRVVLADPAE